MNDEQIQDLIPEIELRHRFLIDENQRLRQENERLRTELEEAREEKTILSEVIYNSRHVDELCNDYMELKKLWAL